MKKSIVFIILFILMLAFVTNISLATDPEDDNIKMELNMSIDKQTVQENDEIVEITLSLGTLEGLELTNGKLVLGYEGLLEYDTDMFESVTVEGVNGWSASYESSTNKIIGDVADAKENTEITKITLKLKNGLSVNSSGKIEITNLMLTDATNDATYNKEFNITVQNALDEENNQTNQPTEDQTQDPTNEIENPIQEENDDSTNKTSNDTTITNEPNLPKTGFKNLLVISILVIAIICIFSLIRYKNIETK